LPETVFLTKIFHPSPSALKKKVAQNFALKGTFQETNADFQQKIFKLFELVIFIFQFCFVAAV